MTTGKQDKEFISAVISSDLLAEAIDWIKNNLNPDEVFDEGELENWADNNGYIKES